jgi:hypothetical protein
MTIEQALKYIYGNERNCRIYSDWDIYFTVEIGDEMNGYKAVACEVKIEDIGDTLIRLARQVYPQDKWD